MGTFEWPPPISGMDGQQRRQVRAAVDTRPPPRRRPRPATVPPPPPCRSGWRRGPGCEVPSAPSPVAWVCMTTAGRPASRLGRPRRASLVSSCLCCLSWVTVAAVALSGPLASHCGLCGWAAGADGMGGLRRQPAVSDPAVPPLLLRPAGPLV